MSKLGGLGGGKGMGMSGLGKSVAKSVAPKAVAKTEKAQPKTGFTPVTPQSKGKMKLTTPIIGGNRPNAPSGPAINKERMKDTIKKLGM